MLQELVTQEHGAFPTRNGYRINIDSPFPFAFLVCRLCPYWGSKGCYSLRQIPRPHPG